MAAVRRLREGAARAGALIRDHCECALVRARVVTRVCGESTGKERPGSYMLPGSRVSDPHTTDPQTRRQAYPTAKEGHAHADAQACSVRMRRTYYTCLESIRKPCLQFPPLTARSSELYRRGRFVGAGTGRRFARKA